MVHVACAARRLLPLNSNVDFHYMTPPLTRLALIVAVALPASYLAEETLCKSGETVYFSCKVGRAGQIASLCGSALDDADRFWLQYRFGRPEKLELVYPRTRTLFSRSGFDVGYFRRPNGFDIEVSFTNGGWSYTVLRWAPGEVETDYKSGVFVARDRAGPGTTLDCTTNPSLAQTEAFIALAQAHAKE